jgi:plastocyanin
VRRGAILLAGAALALTAGASAAEEPSGHDGAVTEHAVRVNDKTVDPLDLIVAPGSRVVWVNVGAKRHTVTSDLGTFDSGTLLPGETFSVIVPTDVGRLTYHCRFHSFIRGSVTVSLVDLKAPGQVAYGHVAALTGTVPGAAAGTEVTVEQLVGGAWTPLLTVQTALNGGFSASTPPLHARALLRATAGGDLSPTAVVGARPLVSARRVGRAIEARVAPARAGLEVRLERLDIDTYIWRPVVTARLNAQGRARLATFEGGVYRVRLPRGVPGVDGGASAAVPVRG